MTLDDKLAKDLLGDIQELTEVYEEGSYHESAKLKCRFCRAETVAHYMVKDPLNHRGDCVGIRFILAMKAQP